MRTKGRQKAKRGLLAPCALFLAASLICAFAWSAAMVKLGVPRALERIGPPAPDLSPVERFLLSAYLFTQDEALHHPAGDPGRSVILEVAEGVNARSVVDDLMKAGIVSNGSLLRNYMRYRGLDVGIQAGDYQLNGGMTVVELAEALQLARPSEILLTVIEGWRKEQIAEAIDRAGLAFGGAAFLAATGAAPPEHPLSGELSEAEDLEGFLFPDTYLLEPEIKAQDLVVLMLDNFESRVDASLRAGFSQQGLNLYQAVTLASIIEREAVVADERPLIASVFLNRLSAGMKLEADPTVQYALGLQSDGSWWKPFLSSADLETDSPYNTYRSPGLPPGPIANPSLSSLQAVADPAGTDYFYFRALCDGSGRHAFAETYEEHITNSCQ